MKSLMIKIFICLESALYLAFTAMDIYAPGDSKWLKFAGIALCFVFSAFLSVKGGEKLVTAAIGLAMAADVFLLLLDKYYIAGVGLFFIVQILYFLRIYRANGRKGAWLVRLFLFTGSIALRISACAARRRVPCVFRVQCDAGIGKRKQAVFRRTVRVLMLRYLRRPAQYADGAARVAAPRRRHRNVDILSALAGDAGALGKGA